MIMRECTQFLHLSRSDRDFSAALTCLSLDRWRQRLGSLHPIEVSIFGCAKTNKRRAEFVSGRHAAKLAVQALTNTTSSVRDIVIKRGVFGQPVLACTEAASVCVSLAHSQGLAVALAFEAGHPMGVDLEAIDDRHTSTLQSQLSETERLLGYGNADTLLELSTHLWCAKEAVAKAMRTGLTVPAYLLEASAVRNSQRGLRVEFGSLPQFAAEVVTDGNYSLAIGLPRLTQVVGFSLCDFSAGRCIVV